MRSILLGVALTVGPAALACPMADAAALQSASAQVEAAAGARAMLVIDGMHCGSCSAKITAKLTAVPGVLAAAVDHQTGAAQVAYDPARVAPAQLVEAVKAAGYKASLKKT